jgi:hypothetical protein
VCNKSNYQSKPRLQSHSTHVTKSIYIHFLPWRWKQQILLKLFCTYLPNYTETHSRRQYSSTVSAKNVKSRQLAYLHQVCNIAWRPKGWIWVLWVREQNTEREKVTVGHRKLHNEQLQSFVLYRESYCGDKVKEKAIGERGRTHKREEKKYTNWLDEAESFSRSW